MMAATTPAAAQDPGGQPALVDALVVNARTPGPAWWSVSDRRGHKVWVLGAARLPAGLDWDASAFERRIGATRRVIAPSRNTRFFLSKKAREADRPWVQDLTEAERERLVKLAIAKGKPLDFYTSLRPNYAALLIKGDVRPLSEPRPWLDLGAKAMAMDARMVWVKARTARGIQQSLGSDTADDLSCLRWSLAERDRATVAQARAEAWARGEVRTLLARTMTYDPCVQSLRPLLASLELNETAFADEIARSLDRGEDAVALVDLVPLLRQDGVLDQLRKRGYRVRTPAQLEDEG